MGAVTANGWLAIIGIATVLQLVLLTVAAVRGVRLLRQATAVVDDLQDVARRLCRADDAVRDAVSRVDLVATSAIAAAKVRVWPVFGALQAVRAAGAAWKRRPLSRPTRLESKELIMRGPDLSGISGMTTAATGAGLFVAGAACGLAIGAALGLLFAPKSGQELRHQVSESAQRVKRKASEVYGGASHTVGDVVARTRHAVHAGREAFNDARPGNGQSGPVDISLS